MRASWRRSTRCSLEKRPRRAAHCMKRLPSRLSPTCGNERPADQRAHQRHCCCELLGNGLPRLAKQDSSEPVLLGTKGADTVTQQRILSSSDVAELLGFSDRLVRRYARDGRIPAFKPYLESRLCSSNKMSSRASGNIE